MDKKNTKVQYASKLLQFSDLFVFGTYVVIIKYNNVCGCGYFIRCARNVQLRIFLFLSQWLKIRICKWRILLIWNHVDNINDFCLSIPFVCGKLMATMDTNCHSLSEWSDFGILHEKLCRNNNAHHTHRHTPIWYSVFPFFNIFFFNLNFILI